MTQDDLRSERQRLTEKLATYHASLGQIKDIPTYEVQQADLLRLIQDTQDRISAIDKLLN